jgi:hypothetical protein
MGAGRRKVKLALLGITTLVVCLCMAAPLKAQVVGATLNGTISDPSGGAIAGAQVACTNLATGVTREVVSDSAGFYTLPNLGAGTYTVTTTASGFSTVVRSDFTLTVGESRELNLRMSVGQVTQKVEVTGEAPAIETSSSEISAVVNSTTIVDLPLNGRSWTDLTILQRGVSVISTTSGETATGSCNRGCGVQLTINGGRPQQNSYRMDGVSLNDKYNAAPGSQGGGGNLGVDTIQEYSVITDNQSAEYGRTSAGVINAITRSGSNSFHGSAFEFLRNSALDSRNFFDPVAGPPPFRRNQFGGSIGGPIQKDKTFFFFAYEGLRQSLATTVTDFVPSADAHNGVLQTGKGPDGITNCPCTVTVDPAIQTALLLFPLPNNGLVTPDQGRYSFASTNIITENFYDARVDHVFSPKDTISGTYQYDKAVGSFPDTFANQLLGNITLRQLATVSETHTFGSSVVNTARLGYTRFTSPIGLSLGAINPAALNPAISTVPGGKGQAGISIGSGFTSNPGGFGGQAQSFSFFNTWQYYDDLFFTKGKHSLKMGIAAENDRQNYDNSTQTGGTWAFAGLAKFLTNQPTSLSAQIPGTLSPRHVNQAIYGAYVQDDFHFRPNLTFNLGLRYEMATVPVELDGKVTNLQTLTQTSPTLGNPWWKNPSYRNFEPRLGFAWDPFRDGKSSVRGGFGMFDVLPLFYEITSQAAQAQPYFEVGAATFNGNTPGLFPTTGFAALAGNPLTFRGVQFQYQPKRNYVMQWNLDLQHQITPTLSVSAGYVGTRGVHQPTKSTDVDIVEPTLTSAGWLFPAPINVAPTAAVEVGGVCIPQAGPKVKINPCFGSIKSTYWLSRSDYNGLVMQIEKRMAHGFYVQGAFTWSKSLDDSSSSQEGNGFANSVGAPDLFATPTSVNPFLVHNLNYGSSDFNVGRTLIINGIWNIPGPHSDNHLVNLAAKGWQVTAIFRANDGEPFTPTWGTSANVAGSYGSTNTAFPDQLPSCTPTDSQNPVHYINASCFTLPAAPDMTYWTNNCDHTKSEVFPACFNLRGDVRRNSLVGPGLVNLDFSMFKNTYVTENLNVQFRAEFFNIANRTNFGNPASSDIFNQSGAVLANVGAITETSTAAREIQFGLKLIW